MYKPIEKPKKRSPLRIKAGSCFYTAKRYILWHTGRLNFAKEFSREALPYVMASHETPMLRRLKNVDMQLQYNKITNLTIATGQINGILLKPGEVFSYWKLIGRTTKKKGYVAGMVLENGGYKAGIGGGLCQLSNLIYWLTLHTELTVTERHRHSYDVFPDVNRTQPFGSGATCFYNYIDLMIENNTKSTYQLMVTVGDTHLQGRWLSDTPKEYAYEVYEKEHLIRMAFWGGYTRHNSLYRRKTDKAGVVVADEFVTENHAIMMYEPLLADKRAAD